MSSRRTGKSSGPRPRATWVGGLIAAPVLAAALTVATVAYWPEFPFLTTFSNILDSLVPQIALVAAVGTAIMAWAGTPRLVTALSALCILAGIAVTAGRHAAISEPFTTDEPSIEVLWFNMLHQNPTPPERLAEALLGSSADLIVLSEADQITSVLPALDAAFALRAGCEGPGPCRMVVLSRRADAEVRFITLRPTTTPRLVRIDLPGSDAAAPPVTVFGMHLNKPWFFGIVGEELLDAVREVRRPRGPVVLVGDFNAAPWSRRMHHFTGPCAFTMSRWPPATWPTGAGLLGVPIDHVLWRRAHLSHLQTWGAELGSNHLGLLAGIVPAPDKPERRMSRDCFPP